MPRWFTITLAVVAVLAIGGYIAFQNYWYYLPGLIASFRDPVQPNREVVWEKGPDTPAATDRPPNIILIVADDLGYNDITLGGGGVANGAVPTPNIDGIALGGANLTQSYSGNATCAPSRAAMLTGRYATRFGFEFTPVPVQFARLLSHAEPGAPIAPIYHPEFEKDVPAMAEMTVPLSETTLPQMLKTKGYRTLMLGKWHLGETAATRPEARGFDEYLGFLGGAALFGETSDPNIVESRQNFDQIDKFLWANLPFAVVNNNKPGRFKPSKYMTDYLSEEAAKAIDANKNRPFFMYVAYNAPHTPLQALKSDYDALSGIENHRLRVYAAMIKALDRGVGTVLKAVKDAGLEDNTLIIFTSDNGGANYIGLPDINKPFRGWKASFFEGGIRVPMLVKWPAKIKAGSTLAGAAGHVDIFATAAAAAGAEAPADKKLDGVNLVPFITGEAQGTPHQTMFWRSGQYRVLLTGDWKLQVSANPNKAWLFNLKDDPTEKTNLAETQPDKLAQIRAVLDQVNDEQAKPLWPSLLEGPIPIDRPLDTPAVEDEEYIYWAN
ncbi:MAG: sulfatase-like hydrolase/transferase [Alphaproteobacteria bacterium]|nr:sulfatase-like hydrolase/transferase [Alphaproteobacteria bacterium]